MSTLFEAAKHWDGAAVKSIVMIAPGLVEASDAKGRKALHSVRSKTRHKDARRAQLFF
jgi:hypothetical protein